MSVVIRIGVLCGVVTFATTGVLDAAPEPPTFAKDVAPILFAKCANCHRPGEVAPMPLLTYAQARPWAKAIREKVVNREMPPWGADPKFGTFRNALSLTDQEIATIDAWVAGGSRRGNDADLPPPPQAVTGWLAGSDPDYIAEMPQEFNVPAEGELNTLLFYTKVPFAEDRFARLLEWRPGNRSVVHHGVAFVGDLPQGSNVDANGELILADGTRENHLTAQSRISNALTRSRMNLLVDYVPGRYAIPGRSPNIGARIPAGKHFKFNLHYQPSGQPEKDRSRIGMWFTTNDRVQELYRREVGQSLPTAKDRTAFYRIQGVTTLHTPGNGREESDWPPIAPFDRNYTVLAVTPIVEPITLYGFTPHMHLRGKDKTWFVTWPDGRTEVLLSIPKYDFNWQYYYELDRPLKVPAGSTLSNIAHYDNTPGNKYNPAPDRPVFWAEQSWDEMYCPFIVYTVDSEEPKSKRRDTPLQR